MTVAIINNLKERRKKGEQVFIPIYTENEIKDEPEKRNTGLFFFKGKQNAPVAICNAGGGFVYVGAIHDSFPHALTLSQKGYKAFALIYRPGGQTAIEDLMRAIVFLHDNAKDLGINMKNYSLWGGSAGARMAAVGGNKGFLEQVTRRKDIPQAAAVIMQHTGYSSVYQDDAPTYSCVGTADGITPWQIMQQRMDRLKRLGINSDFQKFEGLPHGFGLGTGTNAEGWIEHAIDFWSKQTQNLNIN